MVPSLSPPAPPPYALKSSQCPGAGGPGGGRRGRGEGYVIKGSQKTSLASCYRCVCVCVFFLEAAAEQLRRKTS